METEENPCDCTISMTEWLERNDDTKECRSCLLPPVVQWYHEELKQRGLHSLAGELESVVHKGDPMGIAEKFDEIKECVEEDIKARLKEFDCAAQLYKGDTLEQPTQVANE